LGESVGFARLPVSRRRPSDYHAADRELSDRAAREFEGDIGRALNRAQIGIGLFQKVDGEAVPAAADFGKTGLAGGHQHPNQLVGGHAVQRALEKALRGDFGFWCCAIADHPKDQRDRGPHRAKGRQPSAQMIEQPSAQMIDARRIVEL